MHAIDFYTSVCRHVMLADPENVATWSDLRRLLPCLRQSLGCYVCFNLLRDPMGPNHNVCRHFVCRQCVGGKMKLKPSCSWCKDHWLFLPNPLLKLLLACFKKLCIYIYNSPLGEAIADSCVNGETNHLLAIIKEGVDYSDDYVLETAARSLEQTSLPALSPTSLESVASTSTGIATSNVDNLQINNSLGVDNNNLSEPDNIEEIVSVSSFSISKKAHKKKAIKKSVTFMKKAAQNRSKQKLRQPGPAKKAKTINKTRLKGRNKVLKSADAPTDLEKIDVLEPTKKKVKVELHPPELKPLSSCNCGKSGNNNQLTCIGQRCPCYSMKLPCLGTCKCRGCRNPKKGPDYRDGGTCSSAVLRSGTRSATESLCVNM